MASKCCSQERMQDMRKGKAMSDSGTVTSPGTPPKNPQQGIPSGIPPVSPTPIKVTPAER